MSDTPAALTAALADRYIIERELGQGGMATVYLARDLRHSRRVAIKVLKPELGAVLGLERFQTEIAVTANLQHPNLLPLFDSGEAAGQLFYVMPYVEGETLRARLEREKQLPVEDAVRIATAVAMALDYAHRRGVIHRDLKPENILLPDGQPLVADFGIALAVSNAGGQRVTQTGISLGTPAYMSPEQATGDRAIDARTDLYSLGAVTHEMLVGEPPHHAATAQAVIAKLMTEEVRPLTVLRRSVPAAVDMAVRRALEKLPADRWASGKEFAEALAAKGGAVPVLPGAEAPRVRGIALVGVVAAVALAAGAGYLAGGTKAGARTPGKPVRFALAAPDDMLLMAGPEQATVSADGMTIAYLALVDGMSHIRVRRLDELVARDLPSTRILAQPTLSPDGGTLVGLGQGGDLVRVDLATRSERRLGVKLLFTGATWTSDGRLIVGASQDHPSLSTVNPESGEITPFLRPSGGRTGELDVMPVDLPGADAIVFLRSRGRLTERELMITSRAGGDATPLGERALCAYTLVDGYLLYVTRDGALVARRLDLGKRALVGPRLLLASNLEIERMTTLPRWTVGRDGTLLALHEWDARIPTFARAGQNATALPGPDGWSAQPVLSDDESYAFGPWASNPRDPSSARFVGVDLRTGARTDFGAYDVRMDYDIWEDNRYVVLLRPDTGSRLVISMYSIADPSRVAQRVVVDSAERVFDFGRLFDGRSLLLRYSTLRQERLVKVRMDSIPPGESRITMLDSAPTLNFVRTSYDGRWLAGYSQGGLAVAPSGAPSQLIPIAALGGATVSPPVWGRDGRLYAGTGTHLHTFRLDPARGMAVVTHDSVPMSSFRMPDGRPLVGASSIVSGVSRDGRIFINATRQREHVIEVATGFADEVRAKIRAAQGQR